MEGSSLPANTDEHSSAQIASAPTPAVINLCLSESQPATTSSVALIKFGRQVAMPKNKKSQLNSWLLM